MLHPPLLMKIISHLSEGTVLRRMLPLAMLCGLALSGTSCSSTKNNGATGNSQYAEYGATDGGYHPYTNTANTPKTYSQPTYQQPSQYQEVGQGTGGYQQPSYASTTKASSSGSSAKKKKTTPKTVASNTKRTGKTTAKTTKSSGGTTHIVKHGDTLYALARRYHTSVAAIKSANGKTSDLLRDGEKLRIP